MQEFEERLNAGITRRVVEVRETLGMEKQDFADALGLTPGGYTPYEQGTRPWTIPMLFVLARTTGKPVQFFLGLDDPLAPDEQELVWLYRLLVHKPIAIEYLRLMVRMPQAQERPRLCA